MCGGGGGAGGGRLTVCALSRRTLLKTAYKRAPCCRFAQKTYQGKADHGIKACIIQAAANIALLHYTDAGV